MTTSAAGLLPADEADRLLALRSLGRLEERRDDRFGPVVRTATHLFDVPVAYVALLDADRLRYQACAGAAWPDLARQDSVCTHTVLAGRLFVVPDLAADHRFRDKSFVAQDGYRFYAGHPLFLRGHAVGTLCLLGREPRTLSDVEAERLADLGRWAEGLLAGDAAESGTLQALRQRDEVILTAADIAVFGVDADGYVTFANPAAGHLLDEPPERLVGRHFHQTHHHTTLQGTPYPVEACPTHTALRSGARQRARRDVVHRRDGTPVEVEQAAVPLVVDGTVVGAVVTLADRTRERAVERMKDEFVSVVSHELRTPLTSIRGSLGLLSSGRFGELEPQGARLLQIAATNTNRLIHLVTDMLDLERIEAGRTHLEPVTQSLAGVLQATRDAVAGAAESAGVRLEVRGVQVRATVDGEALSRALTNLVANAVKFSAPGSVVAVTAESDDDAVRIRVQDSGRGIPADRLARIFDRFEQVDAGDARDKGGTGLGLAISRSIVERHHGRIEVVSELGVGSTFTIVLPAPAPAPPDDDAPAVVLVEDDEDLSEVIQAALHDQGVRVVATARADRAVELVRTLAPALVVLDVELEGGTGFDVVEGLRREPAHAVDRLLVVTVHSLSADERRRLTLGRTTFLEKGVDGADVVTAVVEAARRPWDDQR